MTTWGSGSIKHSCEERPSTYSTKPTTGGMQKLAHSSTRHLNKHLEPVVPRTRGKKRMVTAETGFLCTTSTHAEFIVANSEPTERKTNDLLQGAKASSIESYRPQSQASSPGKHAQLSFKIEHDAASATWRNLYHCTLQRGQLCQCHRMMHSGGTWVAEVNGRSSSFEDSTQTYSRIGTWEYWL